MHTLSCELKLEKLLGATTKDNMYIYICIVITTVNVNMMIIVLISIIIIMIMDIIVTRCHSEEEMARHLGKLSFADRMSVLDCSAQHRILLTQFVDDAFVFHSSLAGLLKGNRALESFAESWKHMFKGGKKRAAVLAVGAATPAAEALGTLQGEQVRPAQAITVLGPTLDTALSLSPQLELVCCRVQTLTQQLGAALWGLGFGMPQLVAQFSSRVEPAVLHGAEILASHVLGFPYVCKRVNQAQYQAFKALLSAGRDFSLGASGQAKLFASLGVQLRLGTRLGMRICMTRARLLSLQNGHPVEAALEAAPAVTGATWLDHARLIEAEFSVAPGWEVFANAHPAPHSAKEAKRLQAKWKLSVLGPAVKVFESAWFQKKLVGAGLSQACLGGPELRWAPWSRLRWKFHRAWLLCRLTSSLPLTLWGLNSDVEQLASCPLCFASAVDFHHCLYECSATSVLAMESGLLLEEVTDCLNPVGLDEVVAARILFTGKVCNAFAGALRR